MQQSIDTSAFNKSESDQRKYQLTVRLPRDIFQLIEEESEKTGMPLAEIVRKLVRHGLSK